MLESFGATVQVAPDYPRIDAEKLPYAHDSYDIIVLDQIVEHLQHPWRAVDEVRGSSSPTASASAHPCSSTRYTMAGTTATTTGSLRMDSSRSSSISRSSRPTGGVTPKSSASLTTIRIRVQEGTSPVTKAEAERLGIYGYTDSMNYMMTWCIAQKQETAASGD